MAFFNYVDGRFEFLDSIGRRRAAAAAAAAIVIAALKQHFAVRFFIVSAAITHKHPLDL